MVSVPQPLLDPELRPVWEEVRVRLERNGANWRGQMQLPPLVRTARLTLESLIDKPLTKRVDLALVERGLTKLGVGEDLAGALGALGFPLSDTFARARSAKAVALATRNAARSEAERWAEPWSGEWIDGVVRAGLLSGLEPDSAVTLVRETRRLLDRLALNEATTMSREGSRCKALRQFACARPWDRSGAGNDTSTGASRRHRGRRTR